MATPKQESYIRSLMIDGQYHPILDPLGWSRERGGQ